MARAGACTDGAYHSVELPEQPVPGEDPEVLPLAWKKKLRV